MSIVVTPTLTTLHAAYLTAFYKTRRMQRDEVAAAKLSDPLRSAVNLPIGSQAGFFVGGGGFMGQEHDASITDFNEPPSGQPSLWCYWHPSTDGMKLYYSERGSCGACGEWLEYLIRNFLGPWGYSISGEQEWSDEDGERSGTTHVLNNEVEDIEDIVTKPRPSWR